jgi:hypothetical protein
MNPSSPTNGEYETDVGELESDEFEFEMSDESEFESEVESPLEEVEEMELASELLAVSSEQELDQFLGKIFKKIGKGIKKIAKPLGGMLKGIAKKALPFVGGALGSFIPIPGVGTAVGSGLGSAASKLLEVDLEGMAPEDQELELARRFVRLASRAASKAASVPANVDPTRAAIQIIRAVAQQLQAGSGRAEETDEVPATGSSLSSPSRSSSGRRAQGRWYRRANTIVLIGA